MILSIDPDLTSDEVQAIIESTADDKGPAGWDPSYGYGRINVHKALRAAAGLGDEYLVGRWRFNERSGSIVGDSDGDGCDGTVVGATWSTATVDSKGTCLDFSGGDDYVEISGPVILDNSAAKSISAWINVEVWKTYARIFTWNDGVNLVVVALDEAGKIGGTLNGNSGVVPVTTNAVCGANEWRHICLTYDGAVTRIYVDGEEVADITDISPTVWVASDPGTYIGAGKGLGADKYFEGMIDEVAVYNYAVSPGPVGFPLCHPEYAQWVSAGEPDCWVNGRQCHGDADGLTEGTDKAGYYYVHFRDLNTLLAGWDVKEPPLGPGIASVEYSDDLGTVAGICADFAHDVEGTEKAGLFRVHFNDLNILIANWNTKEQPLGPGIATDCLDCGGGDSMMRAGGGSEAEPSFEAMLTFLEGLWLDEEALKGLDQDALLKVTESLAEAIEGL